MRIKLLCLLLCAILAGTLSTAARQHHYSVVQVQSDTSGAHSFAETKVESDDEDSDNDSDDADDENGKDAKRSILPSHSTLDGDLVSILEDSVLKPGKAVNNAITVYGNSSIQGEVFGCIIVVGGNLALNSKVHGDVIVVGGSADLGNDAECLGNTIVIGGAFKKALGAQINKSPLIIGGAPLLSALSWIKNGLLLGRPIVPSLAWVWAIIGVFFILYCLLALLLRKALAAGVEACENHPVGSLLTGLLFFMILTPLLGSLVFSGFGIILLPFVICPLILLACVGKLFVYVSIGCLFWKQLRPPSYGVIIALAIGMALCVLLEMIPFVGFLVWGLAGVMGIGTIILACFQYLSREYKSLKKTPFSSPVPTPIPTASAALQTPVAPGGATSMVVPAPVIQPTQAPHTEPPLQPQSASASILHSVASPVPPLQATTPAATISAIPSLVSEPRVSHEIPAVKPAPPVIQPSLPPVLASQNFPLAGFGIRLCSLALDLIVVTGCLALINHMRLFPLGFLAYHVVLLALRDATLGDLVTGIKCVQMTGKPVGWTTAIVRSLCSIFSIVPLGLGFFWIIWDPRKQSWHDRIANTIMIKTPGTN